MLIERRDGNAALDVNSQIQCVLRNCRIVHGKRENSPRFAIEHRLQNARAPGASLRGDGVSEAGGFAAYLAKLRGDVDNVINEESEANNLAQRNFDIVISL
jgi:hypothetical protein